MTLLGQLMVVHILAASTLTFIYGRRAAPSTGGGILAIFAWLIPLFGPLYFGVFLAARRNQSADNQVDLES